MSNRDVMQGKASFADIYDQDDPRSYVRELGRLQYQIPHHARDIFRFLIRELRARRAGERFTVADLCSSYGINAALVNHDVTLEELYRRYRAPEIAALPSDELVASDRALYAERRRPDAARMIGVDVAANALAYGRRAGVLDVAAAENLEESDPSAGLAAELADVGLITVTGGIGYITDVTFDRLLQATDAERVPWIAAFTLRWVDMAPIVAAVESHGLTVERLAGHTFRQRRFADAAERDHALSELRRLGLDPEGVETDGYHHTWLYLARPLDDAKRTPVEELLAPVL